MRCIAILDDGVLLDDDTSLCFQLEASDGKVHPLTSPVYSNSHGSICARILRAYVPDAPIGSIRVLQHEKGRGNTQNLLAAIDWCVKNNIPIIHMSLGSIECADRNVLLNAAKYALENSVILIAACSNEKPYAWPASFRSVIGVAVDPNLTGDKYHPNPYPELGIDFLASSIHALQINGTSFCTKECNSFAAPTVTAEVWRLLKQDFGQSIWDLKKKMGVAPLACAIDIVDWVDSSLTHVFLKKYPPLKEDTTMPIVMAIGKQTEDTLLLLKDTLLNNDYLPVHMRTTLECNDTEELCEYMRRGLSFAKEIQADILLVQECGSFHIASMDIIPDIMIVEDTEQKRVSEDLYKAIQNNVGFCFFASEKSSLDLAKYMFSLLIT